MFSQQHVHLVFAVLSGQGRGVGGAEFAAVAQAVFRCGRDAVPDDHHRHRLLPQHLPAGGGAGGKEIFRTGPV